MRTPRAHARSNARISTSMPLDATMGATQAASGTSLCAGGISG
jgi:hypothetical protein